MAVIRVRRETRRPIQPVPRLKLRSSGRSEVTQKAMTQNSRRRRRSFHQEEERGARRRSSPAMSRPKAKTMAEM